MGQCFLYGNGSGAGLRVVSGLTRPTSPRENTVWVKSDKAGRKYVLAESKPGSPEEGLIWFSVTGAGIITEVRVYIDDTWTAVDTYLYAGGNWVKIYTAWDGILFYAGNQYTEITGGWDVTGNGVNVGNTISAGYGEARTKKAIDFSAVSKLFLKGLLTYGGSGSAYGGGAFGLINDEGPYNYVAKQSTGFQQDSTWSLDVSNIVGKYRVLATNNGNGTMRIDKIWVEFKE